MFKILAALLMLIDHIVYIFQENFTPEHYLIGRSIGRLAFPMFAYALARGYNRTSNVFRYFLRLACFALLTQLLFNQTTSALQYARFNFYNVLITFTLAFAILIGMDLIENSSLDMMINLRPLTSEGEITKRFSPGGITLPRNTGIVLGILVILLSIIVCIALDPDYSLYGIVTVVIFQRIDRIEEPYKSTLRKDLKRRRWLFCFIAFALLNLSYALALVSTYGNQYSSWIQAISTGAVVFFPLYESSKKPKQWEKYFFYSFYPIHFVLLLYLRSIIL